MILEKQKEAKVLEQGVSQDSIGMSLDLDSAQILMQMLSKNLYSDPIGSTIRECASNALDSHRRAEVDKPIVVSFGTNENGGYEFSVEDFGIGLDAEDVKNIISKYGKSTKRESNTELGMMGLGFKAPLAYSSSFYFVCRKDGMERKYMMYEGEDVNTIDLLYERPTTEDNGVKVIVPVSYGDRYSFIDKIKEQLAYFENVYFNCKDIPNDFAIYRGDLYQYSELSSDDRMHLCLDNVYYPLDFSKLGIDALRIPIALRFSLSDGIFPIPNREALKYTEETKQKILSKISEIGNDLVRKYNESVSSEHADIFAVFKHYSNGDVIVKIGGRNCYIDQILKFATEKVVEPKFKGVNLLDLKDLYSKKYYLFETYECKYSLVNGSFRDNSKSHGWRKEVKHSTLEEGSCYLYEGVIGGVMKDYLRQLHGTKTMHFIKKVSTRTLFGKKGEGDGYFQILNLHNYHKSTWRQRIQEFIFIEEKLFEKINRLEDVVIPQSFIDGRKKKKIASGQSTLRIVDGKVKLKLEGEIIMKCSEPYAVYVQDKHCKFASKTFKIKDLPKLKHLVIYTDHDNYLDVDRIYGISRVQKVQVATFSKREIDIISKYEFHNFMHYDEFMKGDSKVFKRLVTSHLIAKLISRFSNSFIHIEDIRNLSEPLANHMEILKKYKAKNYQQSSFFNDETFNKMLKIAQEKGKFDLEIYYIYNRVVEILEKYKSIDTICRKMYHKDQDMLNCLSDILKYRKFRLNASRYIKEEQEQINNN